MPDASADFVRRLARFFLVGVSATAIHIAALYAFTEFLEVWYVLSSAVAFLIALAFNFTAQKYWVFKSSDRRAIPLQLSLHALVNIFNLIVNAILIYVFVEYFHLWYILAQLVTSAGIAAESFIAYRIIFR
ncbi:MAG TPA: GtrA family protein [Candidatus Paceibacterota bacterium]